MTLQKQNANASVCNLEVAKSGIKKAFSLSPEMRLTAKRV
jgi:hypothetical protein